MNQIPSNTVKQNSPLDIYIKIPGKRHINLPKETGMFIRGQPNSAVLKT